MAAMYMTIWVTLAWLGFSIVLTVVIGAVAAARRRHESARERGRAAVSGRAAAPSVVGADPRWAVDVGTSS